ncbi:MAG: ASPIC/UnbV domain-containing protein [Planctomycetales bacterium]|nr:ASPIC/UnbV domain-containing protein [Planctomycetales bacterium]
MAQSPEENAGTSDVIRYDLGWNAINAMLRAGRSLSGHERNCCFLNTHGGKFANVSAASGLDFPDDGRVLALADWDYDGDVDFWLANRSGPQVRYLRNNHRAASNRISFELEGVRCNRDAIGARISLHWADSPDFVLSQTVRSSTGYLSQSSRWIHFGLGDRSSVDRVEVVWPGGEKQSFENVAANRWLRLSEGDDHLGEWQPPQFPALSPSKFDAPSITDKARIVLLNPIPLPELEYQTAERKSESVTSNTQKLRLVNLWASWCNPCLRELSEWKEHADELQNAGIEIVAVNTGEENEQESGKTIEKAIGVFRSLELPFELRFDDGQLAERLDVIQRSLLSRQRPLPLPTSFLIDADGLLRVVYKGPIEVETLLQDAKLLAADESQTLEVAMPFTGKWLSRPTGSTPLQVTVKLIEGDYQDDAIAYIRRVVEEPKLSDQYATASLLNLLGGMLVDRGEYQKAAEAFAKSLQREPTNRLANTELGTLLLGINRGAAAEKNFRFVLRATPDDPELVYKLGVALLQQNKLREAGRQMQKVLKLRPDAMAHWQIGEILVRMGRAKAAAASYESAIKLKPELARSANNLAWILATSSDDQIRNPERALELAETICEAKREPNELDTLAAALAASGDFDAAVHVAQEAVDAAASNGDATLSQQIAIRLKLYEQRKSYRE